MEDRCWRLLPVLYALWVLPLLPLMAWLMPAWQNADEPAHLMRAAQVAYGGLLGVRHVDTGPPGIRHGVAGGTIPSGIAAAAAPLDAIRFHQAARITSKALAQADAVRWGADTFAEFPATARYPPILYLPAALAIRAAQAAGEPVDRTLRLARLASAAVAAALAIAALAIGRRTRLLLAALAMLPMTLALFASPAPDATIIACTLLAVALLDRAIDQRRDTTATETALLTLLLALVASARPPYAPIALLALLATRRITPRTLIAPAIVLIAAAAWSALVVIRIAVPLEYMNPAAQLHYVLGHPAAASLSILRAWTTHAQTFLTEMIGGLGWLDAPLPAWFTPIAETTLALTLLSAAAAPSRRSWLPWPTVALALAAIALAEYLDWTKPGASDIQGLQGRYLTPLAAILALGMPAIPPIARITRPLALTSLAALALLTPLAITQAVVLRYFLAL